MIVSYVQSGMRLVFIGRLYLLQNKVVSISRRWCKHDDDGDNPVLEEASQGSVEWPVAGPEARERKNALTTELLHDSALGENNTQDVAKGRESDENREGTLSLLAHDVAEERSGENATRREDLVFRNGCEVCDVGKHVKDCDATKSQRGGELERLDGVLRLGQSIVGVAVADV